VYIHIVIVAPKL